MDDRQRAATDARLAALGKLLLIQHTLEVLPNDASMAAFLRQSLTNIPGVKDVHVCVRDVVTSEHATYRELCLACKGGSSADLPPRMKHFPLQTRSQVYGGLFLALESEEQFSFCQPYLQNTANIVATLLEGRDHVHQLQMANRQIRQAHDELEVLVSQRTAELTRSNEQLLRSRQQLRELAAYRDMVREVERKRIAREVHDELGQQLTALRMRLSLLGRQADNGPTMAAQLADMRQLLDRMVGVVRHVASNLRPATLDLGIAPALEWLAEDFEQHSGIRCRFRLVTSDDRAADTLALDDTRATALFRIAQEALTNVARHAKATEAGISLKATEDGISLQVSDNGFGFDPAGVNARRSLGLLGMRERMLILHGALQIQSAPGQGTTVAVELPHASHAPASLGVRQTSPAPRPGSRPRMIQVLIADDHAIVRSGLRQVLTATGEITIASEAVNGAALLDQIRRLDCHVILLDLSMPGLSGFDLIRRVRLERPDLSILVLSMHNEGQIVTRALRAGAAGYVAKDSDPDILLTAIRKVAGGGRFVDPTLVDGLVTNISTPETDEERDLSDREFQVLQMIVGGHSLNEIAESLHLSAKTISTHKMRLMRKLGVDNNADLIRHAIGLGLATVPWLPAA